MFSNVKVCGVSIILTGVLWPGRDIVILDFWIGVRVVYLLGLGTRKMTAPVKPCMYTYLL